MRYIYFVIIVCFIANFSYAAESVEDSNKYYSDLSEGISLLRSGSRDDISRAIAKFKAALKIRRESAEAYYWIALCYSDQGHYIRAIENVKDATIYDEKMSKAWLLWGQILLYQKDWQAALEKLETASRLTPDDPLVLFNLGRVYYHGFNDPDAALPKFRAIWQQGQAIKRKFPQLWPFVIQSRLYMGYCEFARYKWDSAINSFTDVLAEYPENYEAKLYLAICYRHSNRTAEAEQILQGIVRALSKQNSPLAQRVLAEAHLQLANLYLTSIGFKNKIFALSHLRIFVDLTHNSHPYFDTAQEYIKANELKTKGD